MLRLHQASLDHDREGWVRDRPFRVCARKVVGEDTCSDRISRLTLREASGSIGGRAALVAFTQGAAASLIAVAEAMCVRGTSAFAVVFAGGFGAALGAVMGIVIGAAVAVLGKSPRLGRIAFGLYAFAGALV